MLPLARHEDPIGTCRRCRPDHMRIGARIAGLARPTLFVMEGGGCAAGSIGVNVVSVPTGLEQA